MAKKETDQVRREATATWVPQTGAVAPEPLGSNNTAEWWSVRDLAGNNEISLHQWGWSVTTVGGSRYDLPPKRGTDITTAYKPGQIHRRKVPDARMITLLMFMVGWDPGTGLAPPDQRLQWNDNWDKLRRMVYRNHLLGDQRLRLYRRWFLTHHPLPTARSADYDGCIQGDPGVPAPGPRLVTAFIVGEMTGQMQPSMTGRFRSEFQLDFQCSDPFFYGDQVVARVNRPTPTYIWNDGHDVAATGYINVDFVGPLNRPRLTNESTGPNSWVQYNGAIEEGQTIRLVISKYTAELVDTTGSNRNINKVGLITNSGSRWWVNLLPGSNRFRLDSVPDAHAYGYANIAFRHPYV